jgi:hypothetical protein
MRNFSLAGLGCSTVLYKSEAIGMDCCSRDEHSDVSDMGECEQDGDFQNGIGGWRGEVG